MTAPRRDHGELREKIVTSCSSKNRYADQPTAVAMGIIREGAADGVKIYHYRCEICSGWHITHYERSPKGKRNRRCSLDIFKSKE